jgi:7-cyano-7-deazaguanine synthase
MITHAHTPATVGLMLSGGVDSAILLAALLAAGERVQPFYVASGCVWEADERGAVEQFITALDRQRVDCQRADRQQVDRRQMGHRDVGHREVGHPDVAPVVEFDMPVADLYGSHWSITASETPGATTGAEAVALPGRNPLLLLKPILWCGQHNIARLALATLAGNPFADATAKFSFQFGRALATATATPVDIIRPFAELSKSQMLAQASNLPLDLTFSCLAPRGGLHCGACNKCAERTQALQALPGGDPTVYATVSPADISSRLLPTPRKPSS